MTTGVKQNSLPDQEEPSGLPESAQKKQPKVAQEQPRRLRKSPRAATLLFSIVLVLALLATIGQNIALGGEVTINLALCPLNSSVPLMPSLIGLIGLICIVSAALDFLVSDEIGVHWMLAWGGVISGILIVFLVSILNFVTVLDHSGASPPPAYLDSYSCILKEASPDQWTNYAERFYNRAMVFNFVAICWSGLILAILVGSRFARGVLTEYAVWLKGKLPWS